MHDDHHDHDHAHAEIGATERPGYFDILQAALEEMLIERKIIQPGEIERQIDVLDSRTPALGAKVVARAWTDPAFRARLLADGRGACEELGVTFYDDTGLIVLENTEKVHNLVVCTLVLLLPAPAARPAARMVQAETLSRARGDRAARAACRIRHHHPGRRGDPRRRFDVRLALPRAAAPARGHRRLHRGAACRPGHARRDDWRRPCQVDEQRAAA